ncbi:MAG: isocitrate dehydrogenase (NADP(+)) [Desulfobacterales bacterium]|nr:isocitrate dehydrogenase (NADP(+)) [Desulfobacterales bacterium]
MNQKAEITRKINGTLEVPDFPIIPFIEGDGIGPDIWRATRMVIDKAVEAAYGSQKKICWLEVYAGEKGYRETGQWLPETTLETIQKHVIAIKGPLTTPVGKGIRSLNVSIRRKLQLYACMRPIKYLGSVPSPIRYPEKFDMVIFRENTEDVYAGIEWQAGSSQTKNILSFLSKEMGISLPQDAGIGLKSISEKNSKRLVTKAIAYAIKNKLPSVTLMHKGNIMKFTEGAFRNWGYEVAEEIFGDQTLTEKQLLDIYNGKQPPGKVVIKDRLADMLFQQVLIEPEKYHVIATPNLNGDYLSDALAAAVGGLGLAPGANIGDDYAVFEATHGTAPTLAGKDKANPSSLILSGAMMLDYIGWTKASKFIKQALEATLKAGVFTLDLASQVKGAKAVKCSQFAQAIIKRIGSF